MVAGLGNSVFHPADFTLLNRRVSTPRLGHAFSVHGLSGSLGWAAVAGAHDRRGERRGAGVPRGWPPASWAFCALAFLLPTGRCSHDAPLAVVGRQEGEPAAPSRFLGAPVVWMCFVFFFFTVMAFGILQNFAAPIFERSYGVSLALATSGLTAYLLGAAAGTGTGGFFASQGNTQERNVAIALSVAALCAIALATGSAPAWGIVVLMGIMGFGAGFSGPSRDMLVRRAATSTFGQAAFGRIYGFVYSGIDVGLACAPLVFGPLMDAGRYSHVLWGVAVLQTLAIATALPSAPSSS